MTESPGSPRRRAPSSAPPEAGLSPSPAASSPAAISPAREALRLFVALELPEPVREALVVFREAAADPTVWRPVAPEALHVTLAFLGYRREREIERIAGLLDGVASPAPELRLRPDPVGRPPGRPRLFAIEADSPGTVALQAEISDALERARLYEPEKRAFWPHVTVARTRRERRGSNKPAKVDVRPRALPEDLERPFVSIRVRLYRSHLRPQGAEYEPLSSTDLKVSS